MVTLKNEIVALQSLNHQNIGKLIEMYKDGYDYYFVMEMYEGELFDHIDKKGTLSDDEARRYLKMALTGISYCHHINIVHRDLKP